jgi:hypothetical protein
LQVTFGILDSVFSVESDRAAHTDYAAAFLGAYTSSQDGDRLSDETVHVTVRVGRLELPARSRVAVHRSKHKHWTVDGLVLGGDPLTVRLVDRGVVAIRHGDLCWELVVDPETSQATAGETVFHVLRSIAVWRRDRDAGPLLHASGVLDRAGRAVLFAGAVSAGKTTLFTRSVLDHGATPLTNDRAWVLERGTRVQSWPSYASYCEGTLLDHEPLAKAALEFEGPSGDAFRTIESSGPLRRAYTKDVKRIYPMSWFADAAGTAYARTAPLGTLVLAHVDPAVEQPGLEVLDLERPQDQSAIRELLSSQRFDDVEPSFLPWHGLAPHGTSWSADDVISSFRSAGTSVLRLIAAPDDLTLVGDLL